MENLREDETAAPTSSDALFLKHHKELQKAIGRWPNGRVRNACGNAFIHLEKAWKIFPIDKEIALFCAITAEEEASFALIYALKERQYPGSKSLNPRMHSHKSSIWALIQIISSLIIKSGLDQQQIRIATEGPPRIDLRLDMAHLCGLDEPLVATVPNPFEFMVRAGAKLNSPLHNFSAEIEELIDGSGNSDIAKYIENEANLRNLLIYASEKGIPAVQCGEGFITGRLARVTTIACITIRIMQTRSLQPFVLQCMNVLLRFFNKTPLIFEDYYDRPEASNILLELERDKSGKATLKIKRKVYSCNINITGFMPIWPY